MLSPRKSATHYPLDAVPGGGHGKYAKKSQTKNMIAMVALGIAGVLLLATLAINISQAKNAEDDSAVIANTEDAQFPFAIYVCSEDKMARGRYEIVGGSRNSPAYMNTSPISNFTLYKHAEPEDSFVRWYITDVRSLTKYVHRYKAMNPSTYAMGQSFQKVRHTINIEEDSGLKVQEAPCVGDKYSDM
jgi:hypothetical protein